MAYLFAHKVRSAVSLHRIWFSSVVKRYLAKRHLDGIRRLLEVTLTCLHRTQAVRVWATLEFAALLLPEISSLGSTIAPGGLEPDSIQPKARSIKRNHL